MTSTHTFVLLSFAALLSIPACSSSTPEDFCAGWAADACDALAGCCDSGTAFDAEGCRIDLSAACQKAVQVEKVHAGSLVFDSGAASDCLGSVSACSDLEKPQSDLTFEETRACGNMLTGFRPLGAACDAPEQCARAGEFATCHTHGGEGVCAKVVLDDTACGFSFDTGELRVCPDGKHCDRSGSKPFSSDPPSTQDLVFTGKCVDAVPEGGQCGDGLPCAAGLYCDVLSAASPVCTAVKGTGAECQIAIECAAGLECRLDAKGAKETCQPKVGSAYCYHPG